MNSRSAWPPRCGGLVVGLRLSTRNRLDDHAVHNSFSRTRFLLFLSAIALVVGIYSYPALKTSASTGSRALPPMSAPDPSLYLNISTIKANAEGQQVDPYYGVQLPTARLGYLKFRTAFRLFGALNTLLHGNLWRALLLWNLFWWGLLCALAWWLFRQILPDNSPLVVMAGVAVVMLFNFGVLQSELTAWLHLPSLRGFRDVELPYIRPFFPQVPIPLLVLYLGLQIRALQKRNWVLWAAMGLTQLFAFTVFPYAMLMMAGVTAFAIIGLLIARASVSGLPLLFYGLACGLADTFFFFHGSQVARSGAPGQYSLVHLQLSVLPHRIGGMWLVLAVLTASVFLVRDLAPAIRWTLAGLGISNLFFLLGDVFFSETALQVSHHAGYFVQLTAAVLFVFLVGAVCRRFVRMKSAVRYALAGVVVLLALNGALVADATYRQFLAGNEEEAELARYLRAEPPQRDDLVIARSQFVDDDCAWAPLVSHAHVLYCRNAQVLLSPEQNQQIQRFRQALYLYFTGKDGAWVERVLEDPKAVTELTRLMFLGQVTGDAADRQKGVEAVRAELIPLLAKVQEKNAMVRASFAGYRRVLVIDNLANPYFDEQRLSAYLQVEKRQIWGHLSILTCTAYK